MRNYPILAIVLLLIVTRFFFYFQDKVEYKAGENVRIEHTLRQEPKKSEFGQYFFAKDLMVSIPSYPYYEYGDKLLIEGSVESLKSGLLVLHSPKITKLEDKSFVLSVLSPIRKRIVDSVMSSIPPKEGGLLLGILIGSRDKIEPSYYDQLKRAGVLHVVAASGQNVSIVVAVLMFVLLKIFTRRVSILLTFAGIFIYAALTGFDPPIIRASIMAFVALGALALGKQNNSLYALFITAYIMVFFSPEMISDVAFLLSFASTLGIVVLNPILGQLFSNKSLEFLKEDIVTTISAQLATFPILLNFFQSYSLLSIPINLMVLFTIPIIMILGAIGAALSLLSPVLGLPFYMLAYPFLLYFGAVIGYFSRFNFELNLTQVPTVIVIGYYFVLVAIVVKLSSNRKYNA